MAILEDDEAALRCVAQLSRYEGLEQLHYTGERLDVSVAEFWRWARSDLVTNTERGVFAEFIVAVALNVPITGVRNGAWSPIDLTTPEGTTVQVRSAAYLQSWYQARYSTIEFDVEPKRAWNLETNTWAERGRHADVYVFALLLHRDKRSVDPLDMAQWMFYVLPTAALDGFPPRKISLAELQGRTRGLHFDEVQDAVLAMKGERT